MKRIMRSEILDKLLKEMPLKTRLKVTTEIAFINLLFELGYRENRSWNNDEDEKLNKLIELASELTNDHIEEMEKWIKDGKP